jgi:hypothetical protein
MNKKLLRLFSLFLVASLFAGSFLGVSSSTAFAQEPAGPESGDRGMKKPARVRVAHFASFAGSVEGTSVTVRVNGEEALADFQFGDIAGPIELEPGKYEIEILPTGTDTVAIQRSVWLERNKDYTLAAIGNGSLRPLQLFVLQDDTQAPESGAKLRVAHLAPFADSRKETRVDICTDDGMVVDGLAGIPYKADTHPYLLLPAGDYDLKIAAPDGTCETTYLDLPSLRLADGDIADVFAIGDNANLPLQYASTTGLTTTPPAMVRVAHFASFANTEEGTSVTVRVNGEQALTGFQFGDITGALELEPGTYSIEVLPTGSDTVAISGMVELEPETSYTLAAIGNGTLQPLELFALVDDTRPANNRAKLRVAHLAPFASDLEATRVDVCTQEGMVVPGLEGVPYKGYTDPYLRLDPGQYDLKITAAGTGCATTLIDLDPVTLNAGDIASAFAVGDGTNFPPQVALSSH